ncbi:MAG: Crp/Fnr family transcriptional regulator [Pseudomonadota bacterium]
MYENKQSQSGVPGAQPGDCEACDRRVFDRVGAITAEEQTALLRIAHNKRLAAGQTYVIEGDRARDFASVTKGVAKMVRCAEDGRSQIVGLLFPKDFVGGPILFEASARELYSIEAVTELHLCLFSRAGFRKVLLEHPALEHRLLNQALDELQLAREWMVLLGRKTAAERVASFLLYVGEKMQAQPGDCATGFDLPVSRADIADFVGLTVETVSRQITKLRKAQIIVMDGPKHVVSLDMARLRLLTGF